MRPGTVRQRPACPSKDQGDLARCLELLALRLLLAPPVFTTSEGSRRVWGVSAGAVEALAKVPLGALSVRPPREPDDQLVGASTHTYVRTMILAHLNLVTFGEKVRFNFLFANVERMLPTLKMWFD